MGPHRAHDSREGVAGLARGVLTLCLALGATALALYLLDLGCVFKGITGLSCPGCGMTRAWLAALKLDLAAAVAYHPLFWTVPIALLLACAQGPCAELAGRADAGERDASSPLLVGLARAVSRLCAPVFVALLAATLLVWALRLADPADAGMFLGGVVPAGVEADVVGWAPPAWLGWLGA